MASMSPIARGGVLSVVLPLLAGGTAVTALVLGLANTTTTTTTSSVRHRLTAAEVRAWLVRAGLDPKALAVANVPAGQIRALVGGAADSIVQNSLAMEQAELALSRGRTSVERLERSVRGGTASADDLRALATARDALAAAQGQVGEFVAGVFTAATAGLSPEARAALQGVKRNRGRGVPMEFTLADRTDAQWVALRDALSARAIAQREGRQIPDAANALVSAATTPASTAAADRLRTALPAIQAAWEQAVRNAQGR